MPDLIFHFLVLPCSSSAQRKTKGSLDSGSSLALSKGFSKWVYRLTLARWYYNYAWGWIIGYFLSTLTIYYLIPGLAGAFLVSSIPRRVQHPARRRGLGVGKDFGETVQDPAD